MHTKNIVRHLLFAFLSVTTLSISSGFLGNPMAPGAGMQAPSLDDIKAMEQEIDNFVRNLPPEQQKQFYKDVEELTGIMEKMSPDELSQFVGTVFSDAGIMEPAKPAAPAPAPKIETPTKELKPAVVITTAPSGPTEKALAMINALIDRTEEFTLKSQIIPELQGNINSWVTQKKLADVSAKLDWVTLKQQIEEFKALLYDLLQQDQKTHVYKHIGNLIKDEALYSNLAALQVTLEAYVPKVFAPDFGLEKVSDKSREAIGHVLSQYIEAFSLLNVPASLKKIIQLYEPRAKELTDEEQKLVDQAKKELQKTRRAAPSEKTPGAQNPYTSSYESPYDYDNRYGSGYGYDHGYDRGYGYSEPSSSSATPLSTEDPGAGSLFAKVAGSSGKTPGSTLSAKKDSSKEGEGEEEKETKGGKEETKAPATKKAEEFKSDSATEHKVWRIVEKLEDITEPMKLFGSVFTKFKDNFDTNDFDNRFINDQLVDMVHSIEINNTQLKKSIADIKSFKKSLDKMNKPSKDHYKKELSKGLKDIIKFYKTLHSNVSDIKSFIGLPAYKNKFNANKLYVYFGQDTPSAAVLAKVPTAPAVTMDNLDKTIQEFLKEAE